MRISALLLLLIGIYMSACVSKNKNSDLMKSDEFSWLEEVEGDRALKWVDAQNQKSLEFLKSDPRFPETQKSIEKILADKNRIPFPTIAGPMIYNHWTDEKNPRGLWRRCTLQEYKKAKPNWEIVIDVDQLGKAENVSWVFKGAQLLPPDYKRALVSLSRGGKDAREIREFDLEKKTFIKEGFFIPEAKSDVAWIDENTLHVGTDFGPATMTKSGYPRIVKIWKRGQPLTEAKLLFEGNENDVGVNSFNIFRPEKNYTFVTRSLNFFESQIYYLKKSDELVLLPIPKKADINGVLNEKIYFSIHEDWQDGKQRFTSGSLLQFDLKEFLKNGKTESQLIFQPDKRSSLNNVVVTRTKVWLEISRNVNSSVLELNRDLTLRRLSLPKIGTASIVAGGKFDDKIFILYSNFLVPSTLYFSDQQRIQKLKSLPQQFDAKDLVVKQFDSLGKDGTKIPYFLIHKKSLPYNSQNPTLLYAYGGFQVSMEPDYAPIVGKTWLEKGGVYVLANIRGGGEFGPNWHQAALKQNRQIAFDDFYSVAEDLIRRKITSSSKLAIRGGSNGGLLVGVALTQRPELFHSAICEVPLLDMLKFHQLLAGASWMAEYGNPDLPDERAYIEKYSPYQNLKSDKKYPYVFFTTSTKDDRVHPGHARKMAALFEKNNFPYLYYENREGGHGAAADLKQKSFYLSLQNIFLMKQLMD